MISDRVKPNLLLFPFCPSVVPINIVFIIFCWNWRFTSHGCILFPHFSNLTLGNVYFWKIIALFRAKGEQTKLSCMNTALFSSQILPLFPTNNFLESCGISWWILWILVSHKKGKQMWILKCIFKLPSCVNALSHCEHW